MLLAFTPRANARLYAARTRLTTRATAVELLGHESAVLVASLWREGGSRPRPSRWGRTSMSDDRKDFRSDRIEESAEGRGSPAGRGRRTVALSRRLRAMTRMPGQSIEPRRL